MVSSLDDQLAELSEYFTLMITSVDRLDVVEIGSPNTSVITIEDNDGACVCACVCTLECHGWVESFIYVCTQYERLSLNASSICMQWHICTYNMTCMYMYMHKVLYNVFTCSCSADVCSTKLHCHWGQFSQYHIESSSSFWRLWLYLHCDSPVHEWVSYWWVCFCCSNCQGLVILDITFTSQWSFPFSSQQLAMTIHLVRTLWTSLLVKHQPPWWCLPWTTTQQSYQSTSVWRLPPLTN